MLDTWSRARRVNGKSGAECAWVETLLGRSVAHDERVSAVLMGVRVDSGCQGCLGGDRGSSVLAYREKDEEEIHEQVHDVVVDERHTCPPTASELLAFVVSLPISGLALPPL
eukprot:3867139-Rhodomonas_salina.1